MNFHWLARMFTIPSAQRAKLTNVPGIHVLANAVQSLTVSVAQSVVSKHVSDPAIAQKINDEIALEAQHAIPIPAGDINMGDVITGVILPPILSHQ